MTDDLTYHLARPEDLAPAFRVFRRALFDYLYAIGMASEEERDHPPVESAWARQQKWIEHLWNSSVENWVARDAQGQVAGWAMGVERNGHLELTMFFVDPGVQAKGAGRKLLDLAFPAEKYSRRTVIATQSPRALRLYLQSGVEFVTTSMDVLLATGPAKVETDLAFERADRNNGALEIIAEIDRQVLGFRREVDTTFLLDIIPGAWIARRNGTPVGYAFGMQPRPVIETNSPPGCGPMAALDPKDVPALIDHVLAQTSEVPRLAVGVPMANRVALAHLLGRGGQIDPFYVAILSTDTEMKLDRFIHTSPAFIL